MSKKDNQSSHVLDVEEEVAYIQAKMGGAPAEEETQTGTQKKWNYQAKKKASNMTTSIRLN